jgi:hypothetical protein
MRGAFTDSASQALLVWLISTRVRRVITRRDDVLDREE